MKLSIIIPNHNGIDTILKNIDSIYNSNNLNKIDYEIIIIDDASIDNSIDLVEKKYPTIKLIKNEKNMGASYNRNIGIKNSNGDLLLFLDNDTWFNKNTIWTIIKSMTNNIDIVFPKILFEDGKIFYPLFESEKKYPLISACFMIKRNSLEKLDEYFDEFYGTYLEDYDFFIRCSLAKLNAKYVDEARAIHANKNANVDYSKRYFLEIKNTLYGIKKFKRQSKKIKISNPFTKSTLKKELILGIFNFAWFNWYAYDRNISKIQKIKLVFSKKNKIFLKNRLLAIKLRFKAHKYILQNNKQIKIKIKKFNDFYQ
ncbi:glycosyltransferase [archaeon]|jgi:glycosyltransferase involved in cell wall biosynthesis|nr:glycosyltransferase [Candidatus Woesearchaeota archaeon]MBT4351679.1 glycosyltransferase [archaeon]MBT4647501.1 glycosyltransferase [archaeon]MBT6822002.1 glycosyltransferase [archaeon]MBT7392384.1 glycosyltransferase [archaeon]